MTPAEKQAVYLAKRRAWLEAIGWPWPAKESPCSD